MREYFVTQMAELYSKIIAILYASKNNFGNLNFFRI